MILKEGGEFSVLLENSQMHHDKKVEGYFYEKPIKIIKVTKAKDIAEGLGLIQKMQEKSYHLAGWISYEVGLYLEEFLRDKLKDNEGDMPYIHLGVYKSRMVLSQDELEDLFKTSNARRSFKVENLKSNITRKKYNSDIAHIQEYLASGDVYQVNHTMSCRFNVQGRSKDLYAVLRKAQRVEYSAYIKGDGFRVLSLSPELFVEKKGSLLKVRPMKGTCERGHTLEEDIAKSQELKHSIKNRAENLMIVDLLRNDLSKISKTGSVKVTSLYNVEKYRTLLTMTSQIEAEILEDISVITLIKSLFPCGSVTGAPKIRAMEIIHQLEQRARGIYCGAIGFFSPDGDMCFSVPIRTLYLKTIKGGYQGEMGIGSAVVADSTAQNEYEECLLKAEFLIKEHQDFDLIETFGYSENKFQNLEDHLSRLKNSAEYFGFLCDMDYIRSELKSHEIYLTNNDHKIRLLLSQKGKTSITSEKISLKPSRIMKIKFHRKRIKRSDSLLYHKTTARFFYNTALEEAQLKGFDEVIFLNEEGYVTEGSYTNIFIELDQKLYTPSRNSGLLNGILRQNLIGQGGVIEQDLTPEDFKKADKIYVGNNLRGLLEARLTC